MGTAEFGGDGVEFGAPVAVRGLLLASGLVDSVGDQVALVAVEAGEAGGPRRRR